MRLRYPAKPTLNLPANSGRTSMSGVLARGPQGLPGTPNIAWAATTAYALDQVVMAPDGSIIKCTLAHTSAATFDATEAGKWKAIGAVSGTKAYTDLGATYASFGPDDPGENLPVGTEYIWLQTDGNGNLIDILSGVAE